MYLRREGMGGIDQGVRHPFGHMLLTQRTLSGHSAFAVRRGKDRGLEYQPDHLVYSLVYSSLPQLRTEGR